MTKACLKPKPLGIVLLASLLAACGAASPTPSPSPFPTPTQPAPTIAPPATSTPTVQPTPRNEDTLLIFDDDGSRDGMAALVYLLESPGIAVKAITISYGEAHPELYIQHVGRVLDQLAVDDIPLGAGQDTPLAGGTAFPGWLREMSNGFWGYPLAYQNRTYAFTAAPELIASTIRQVDQPLTIFVSGTFTNLAQALRADPSIRDGITAVYFMGGAVHVPGNITNLIPGSSNAVAEWNILADPQAAREIFDSGLRLFMIPLDATNQVTLRQADILPWRAGGEAANLVADLYEVMFGDYGFETVEIFDLTAAAVMAAPDLCAFEPLRLEVVTQVGNSLGQTRIVPDALPNVSVCLHPDVPLLREAMDCVLSAGAAQTAPPFPDALLGSWQGSAVNQGFELSVSVMLEAPCRLGQVCGRFDLPTVACSGTLTWVGMEGDLYRFQAGDKTAGCGEGADYLAPRGDGTLEYISRGEYGETTGILRRSP
jgi:purine nucleosidase/pyrimidine-specific ribonucleoside hydrolase